MVPGTDFLIILSMCSMVANCIVLPLAGQREPLLIARTVAIAYIVIAAHPLNTAAHYRLFSRYGRTKYRQQGRDVPYVTDPRVIVEVFSPITEDIDRREKVLNYRRVTALEEYLLIAQRSPQVIVFRRSEDWSPVELTALDAVVESRAMEMSMSLRDIYAGTSLR